MMFSHRTPLVRNAETEKFVMGLTPHASLTRTVVAGAIGNVLEWFDFGLFGFFAPVIARQFLPAEDNLASLLGTFGVFATGFLMRPLGGLFFGYIGDRLGRKLALEVSVLVMAVSTTLMGMLPVYATVGLAAPLLLTAIRLLQGLSVGGEYIGSMSFLTEHAPANRRAFVGSWSSFTVVLGSLLGSGTAALCTGLLSEAQLTAWGWRLPFLGSVLLGALGFWLRLGVQESPSFAAMQKAGQLAANPIAEVLHNDRRAIFTTLGLAVFMAVSFYLPFVWLPTWLAQINRPHLPESHALAANTAALMVLLVLTPVAAVVSDRIGRKPMFLGAALGYAFLSYPLFLLMTLGTLASAMLGGILFAVVNSLYSGCMAATMVEMFPTRTRYSGVAISYNVGQTVFGGTAPLLATALIGLFGNHLAPAFYLSFAAVVGAVACIFINARYGQPLDQIV
jgi:MHS family proline/betaine transporter-like MFS transporter